VIAPLRLPTHEREDPNLPPSGRLEPSLHPLWRDTSVPRDGTGRGEAAFRP
jgi:hypothetical protein